MPENYNAQENKVVQRLSNLKRIEADSVFLKTLRAQLLIQVEQEQQFLPNRFPLWNLSKLAFSFAAFLLLLGGVGLGVSKASQISDPANIFYRVRLTSERIQLSFSGDKTALHAQFAQNRLQDIQKLEQTSKLEAGNLHSVLQLYLENLYALQQESEQLAENSPEFASAALKLEIQLRELHATITQLSARLQTDSLTPAAIENLSEAEALSLWNRQLISLKILAFQKANNILLGNNDAEQLERIAFLLDKVNNRFSVLNSRWQEVFLVKTQPLQQETSLAPEKLSAYALTENEQAILAAVSQVKTSLSEIQTLLKQKSEPTPESILLLINKLFEIDNNLAKIEALLE